MKVSDILKKYVLPNLPYLMFLWVSAKLGETVRLAPGADASMKMLGLSEGFSLPKKCGIRKRPLGHQN